MNKWTQIKYPVKEMIDGSHLNINVYELQGSSDGPVVYIQSSVHGAELQGNAVILSMLESLAKENIKGKIIFVPLANPFATNQKIGTYTLGRYNPITGHNWNRNFLDIFKNSKNKLQDFVKKYEKSNTQTIMSEFKLFLTKEIEQYEQNLRNNHKIHGNNSLNILLQKIAAQADIVLDLHTGPIATEYLYTAKRSLKDSAYLSFKHVLVVENIFATAMDEATFTPWVYLENAYKELGRTISFDTHFYTLELGSEEVFSISLAKKQALKIFNYLSYKKVISGDAIRSQRSICHIDDYLTLYAAKSGLIDYKIEVGSEFKKGDILGVIYHFSNIDLQSIDKNATYIIAPCNGILINHCPSCAVHEGMELFQIMSNISFDEQDFLL